MLRHIKNAQYTLAAIGLLAACNGADPSAPDINEEVLAAVVEADAPPIGAGAIAPGTITDANGVTWNAIAVHIVGDGDNGTHNAFRVVAWVPAVDGDQKPPFDRLLRVGVRTRGSPEAPIGETIAIGRFDPDTEQRGFAFYVEVASRGRWVADQGEVTVAALDIDGDPQGCQLPEDIDIDCTVAAGSATGSFQFTATQHFSANGEVYNQPLTPFDLPALQVNVNGSLHWKGLRKGRGRGRGWGFGG